MRRLVFVLAAAALFAAIPTSAQAQAPATDPPIEDVMPTPTQEMWFYLQELRRHDDPKMAIRRKEEIKADQRRARLAALKWFGFSPGRPVASPIPFMGVASPAWVGNAREPYQWIGGGIYRQAVRIDVTERR